MYVYTSSALGILQDLLYNNMNMIDLIAQLVSGILLFRLCVLSLCILHVLATPNHREELHVGQSDLVLSITLSRVCVIQYSRNVQRY